MHRLRNQSRAAKTVTYSYYVKVGNVSETTCKKYFIDTFNKSNGRLQRALQRSRVSSPGEDLRGRHEPVNKTSKEKLQDVKNHIHSFTAYQSHYTRSHNPNKKYFDSKLNLRLMYNLCTEKCVAENMTYVSEAIYRNVFHRILTYIFTFLLKIRV